MLIISFSLSASSCYDDSLPEDPLSNVAVTVTVSPVSDDVDNKSRRAKYRPRPARRDTRKMRKTIRKTTRFSFILSGYVMMYMRSDLVEVRLGGYEELVEGGKGKMVEFGG
jgi:hypothetical protein